MLPILDATLSPNEYYDISPFLFWSIVITGSRRYSDDSSFLDALSGRITSIAFSSMSLRTNATPVIQGLLILTTWRLPTSSVFKDLSHVLCGSAINLATLNGLHVAGVGQDFSRVVVAKDPGQKFVRAKLWLYCVIVSIK